jgi:hypothetical protein
MTLVRFSSADMTIHYVIQEGLTIDFSREFLSLLKVFSVAYKDQCLSTTVPSGTMLVLPDRFEYGELDSPRLIAFQIMVGLLLETPPLTASPCSRDPVHTLLYDVWCLINFLEEHVFFRDLCNQPGDYDDPQFSTIGGLWNVIKVMCGALLSHLPIPDDYSYLTFDEILQKRAYRDADGGFRRRGQMC